MNDEKTVHIFVEGDVQGVGFRAFVAHWAADYSITGWVRNRFDDRVEILAQGSEENLQKLIAMVRIGPVSGLVTNVEIKWSEFPTRFDRFFIAQSV